MTALERAHRFGPDELRYQIRCCNTSSKCSEVLGSAS